jgi:hypothetical protein
LEDYFPLGMGDHLSRWGDWKDGYSSQAFKMHGGEKNKPICQVAIIYFFMACKYAAAPPLSGA